MVLFNKLLLCMQLLHHGMIWDTRAGIKLREQCCGWAETCNEFAERGVKQNWEGRNGLGKGSFYGLGVHLSDCIYLWWGEMSDRHNREGKHSACLVSPSLCSRSHALIIIRNTRSTPQVTTSHPFSSTPTETLSPAWHPVSTCQPSFLRAACPRALLPGLPMPQLTIARTIRIFRGIMTGLVKHSCPWKSLIFLAAVQSVPRRAGCDRVHSLQHGTQGSADVPSNTPAPVPSPHSRGRCATALPSLWAPPECRAEFQRNTRWLVCHSQECHQTELAQLAAGSPGTPQPQGQKAGSPCPASTHCSSTQVSSGA